MAIRRRPVGLDGFEQLHCDRCGQLAIWRQRVVAPCCAFGEALCDNCEKQGPYSQWKKDRFWHDLAGDVAWFWDQLVSGVRKLQPDRKKRAGLIDRVGQVAWLFQSLIFRSR